MKPMRPSLWTLCLASAGVVLLSGFDGGCGAAASPAVMGLQGPSGGSGATNGSLRWIGLDSRPLAVGSQITVSFETAAGAACCSAGYTATSSDPAVLAVTDQGNQTLGVRAVAAGQAEIEVMAPGSGVPAGTVAVTTAEATSVTFGDPSHLAAGLQGETDLPPSFALLRTGSEILQAVVTDAAGDTLASEGLATGHGTGAISVVPEEPDQFYLTALPASGDAGGTFVGGLASGQGGVTFQIALVGAAVRAKLDRRTAPDGSVFVLARALTEDGTEVLGVPTWSFSIDGPGTVLSLADAAAELFFPAGTASGATTLTATSGNLSAQITVP